MPRCDWRLFGKSSPLTEFAQLQHQKFVRSESRLLVRSCLTIPPGWQNGEPAILAHTESFKSPGKSSGSVSAILVSSFPLQAIGHPTEGIFPIDFQTFIWFAGTKPQMLCEFVESNASYFPLPKLQQLTRLNLSGDRATIAQSMHFNTTRS